MTCGFRGLWVLLVLTATTGSLTTAGVVRSPDHALTQDQPARLPAVTAVPEDLGRAADEVAREVEALRGWTFKEPVRKSRSSPQQVRQYLEQQIESTMPAGQVAVVQAFLRTIGLIPPGLRPEGHVTRPARRPGRRILSSRQRRR